MSLDLENPVVASNIDMFKSRGILLPTLEQMIDPSTIPQEIQDALKTISIEETNPLNLFRITWKNDDTTGGFREVPNFIEIPSSITGCKARMILLVGKYFPTGAHKVGATYCALVDHLTTGKFDPKTQEAMWPSTGNYCRGGAFDSCLLGCKSVALLPEEMSQERFDYLRRLGAEVFGTPGCESNVKEIFDKAKELVGERGDGIVNFNQFEQFGNPAWHKFCTGRAVEDVFNHVSKEGDRLAGYFSMSGSAGTIGASEYIREIRPRAIIGVGEPEQCPVITMNGFGGHRIEGVGDKHIPWVHNVRNMDFAAQIDDDLTVAVFRLLQEKVGQDYLRKKGCDVNVKDINLMGISGVGNLLGAIKMAKYYELTEEDVVFTIATDSAMMYQSRLAEYNKEMGEFSTEDAIAAFARLHDMRTEGCLEMTYAARKRIHNLKYFNWVEGQGKDTQEVLDQWYDLTYWQRHLDVTDLGKRLIETNEKILDGRTVAEFLKETKQ